MSDDADLDFAFVTTATAKKSRDGPILQANPSAAASLRVAQQPITFVVPTIHEVEARQQAAPRNLFQPRMATSASTGPVEAHSHSACA